MNAIAPLALVVGGLAVVGFFVWLNAPRLAFVHSRELVTTLKRAGYKPDPVWTERAEDEEARRAMARNDPREIPMRSVVPGCAHT